MSAQPPELQSDEIRIHAMFKALREQTVEVARGLSERIVAQLSAAEERRVQPPGIRSMLGDALVQFLNLMSGAAAAPTERDDDES